MLPFALVPRRRPRLASLALVVALATAWLAIAPPALAQTFTPVNATWNGDGYSLTISDEGMDHVGGRRPVRLRFQRLAAASTDVELFVEYEVASRFNRVTVAESFTLPAGRTAVEGLIRVPSLGATGGFGFRVFENGTLLRNLAAPTPDVYSYAMRGSESGQPRFLFLKSDSPNHQETTWLNLAATSNTITPNPYANQPGNSVVPREYMHARLVSWRDAPSQWADYSGFDFVAIGRSELATLVRERPEAWRAIREWVGTGGNLIVGDCGRDWGGLSDVEKLFELPASSGGPDSGDKLWASPKTEHAGQPVEEFRDHENEWWAAGASATTETGFDVSDGELDSRVPLWSGSSRREPLSKEAINALREFFPSLASPDFLPRRPARTRFTHRPFQLGMIVAVEPRNLLVNSEWTSAEDVPLTPDEWRWMFKDVGPARCLWENRSGVTFTGDNSGHAGFRIPGVGRAPVGLFQILITLFALFIGPVNFYWLRRRHRLHLMLLTVPLCAGVATIGLLAYALVADGFGTQSRVRSLTLIDEPLGQTVSWSRQAYYAGLTPMSGLKFSPDVLPLPVQDARDTEEVYRPSLFRRLVWADGRQDLADGWLTGRKPTQFLNVRARPSTSSLKLGAAANGQVPITNQLGTKIHYIYYRDFADERGQADAWYTATNVEAGASGALASIEPVGVRDALAKLINQQIWEVTDESNSSGMLFRPRYYYNQKKPVLAVDGVMENRLQGLARFDEGGIKVEPGMYVAIVERSPEVELGLDGVDDHDGFHVVIGRRRAP